MKHIFTVLGIAGLLVVALTVTNVAAQSPQAGTRVGIWMTPMPLGQSEPTASSAASWGMGMGMGHGKPGGGMMAGHRGARGGTNGSTPMNYGPGMMQGQGSTAAGNGPMMTGVTPMHEDVAHLLGMTSQDLYNHMAAGRSMAQIAAEQGLSEQQLMDAVMAGRQAAYGRAVRGGYMTQAQADAMYQNMQANLKTMVNGQGEASPGWSMMWGTQPTPQPNR